jgi:RimJ/RimL family protein N-acetyltransferase
LIARDGAVGPILPSADLSRQAFHEQLDSLALRLGVARMRESRMASGDGTQRVNEYGQPIGFALEGWTAPPFPPHATLAGRYCRLEPLQAARHASGLWEAQAEDATTARWTYLFNGPFADFGAFEQWCQGAQASRDPQFYAIVVGQRAMGMAAYMRIEPSHGVIEIGNIYYAPRLARTRAATEAMYLFMANVFELGFRRYEWKCDSCNLPSRAAASRLGFTYEGKFRQAIVYKKRNRDTTWYSVIDADWHAGLQAAYLRWLDPANFDAAGNQKLKLTELTSRFVHSRC